MSNPQSAPPDAATLDLKMSNFDHVIDSGLAERLQGGNFIADYFAWNFKGVVWFQDSQFHCEIWRYRQHVDTIHANSLQDIMDIASTQYGQQ
jgi:hypothetical protein